MTTENNRLPDALRPTELHDFSDMPAAGNARGYQAKAILVIAAIAALILGMPQMSGTTPAPRDLAALQPAH